MQTPGTSRGPAREGRLAHWAPLAVLMAGTFMFVLDFFIVNVALPSIQHGLHAGGGAIEWVVAGYSLTTATLLITWGRLGDHLGRRRAYMAGLTIFVVSSALCALALDPTMLVAARLLQGVGAAALAPNILSLIGVLYQGQERTRAISVYGMVLGLAATTGQLIGGILINVDIGGIGWRAIFWINLPIGLSALVAAPRLLPPSRVDEEGRFDIGGVVLATTALVAALLPLIQGRADSWPVWSWVCLGASPLLFAGFWFQQRRTAKGTGTALLDPSIVVGPLRVGLITQLTFWTQQAAGFTFLALYLQDGRHISPLRSGVIFAMLAAGFVLTSFPAPALVQRFGRNVVLVGSLTAGIGDVFLAVWVFHIGTGGSAALLLPGLFLIGAGQGACLTPLTATIMAHATPTTAGAVNGALSTLQQAGNAIGVAVFGVVFYGQQVHGYGNSYAWTAVAMAVALALVALLTRALPPTERDEPAIRTPDSPPASEGMDGHNAGVTATHQAQP